jgi:hypothetical protein
LNIDHISSRLRTSKPVINNTVISLDKKENFANPTWVEKDKRYIFTNTSNVANTAKVVTIYSNAYSVIWETSAKKGSIQKDRIHKIESLDPVGEMLTIHR